MTFDLAAARGQFTWLAETAATARGAYGSRIALAASLALAAADQCEELDREVAAVVGMYEVKRAKVDELREYIAISERGKALNAAMDAAGELQQRLLQAEHEIRLVAERTGDYTAEGLRLRLIAEADKLAAS